MALLLLTAVTLLVSDPHGTSGPAARLRGLVGDVIGPVQRGAAAAWRPARDVSDDLRHLGSQQQRVSRLERENDRLRGQLATTADESHRLAALEELLTLPTLADYPTVTARVVAASSLQSLSATVTIDAGTDDGLRVDAAVVNGRGLVGRVTSVSRTTATVLLACDPRVTVFVRAGEGGRQGQVTGRGCGKPAALLVPDPAVVIAPGAPLLTTGSPHDRPYVPGIPVGTVASVSSQPGTLSTTGTVSLVIDVGRLDYVAVVLPGEPALRRPAVAATPTAGS